MAYSKTCKICGKSFESDSKNTVYCSDKCAKRGAKKAYVISNLPFYKDLGFEKTRSYIFYRKQGS